jgi:S1-C subfamily serine protease
VSPTQSSPVEGGFTPLMLRPRGGGDDSWRHVIDNLDSMTVESGDFDDDHDGPESSEDPPIRPWLPPDDRLWRHPSELRSAGTPPTGIPGIPARGRQLPGGRLWFRVVLGGVVGAVVATGVITGVNSLGPARTSGSGGSSQVGGSVTAASAVAPATGLQPAQNHTSISAGPSLMGVVAKVWPSIVTVDVATGTGHVRGSGVVFRSDGMVLTVARLLAGAVGMSVITSSGQEETASVVGEDADDDVAVLRVGHQLPSVSMASTAQPATGQVAIAVGATDPVGSPPAVTIGTIKGVNRQVRVNGGPPLLDAIDTDAPPGPTPGGALLDQSGRVVGITTETTDDGGGAHWLAAPAALVGDAADQLVTKGKVVHAWLGISADDRGPSASGGSSSPPGVQVLTVQNNSPAASAGLLPQDVIDAVDGQPVPSILELQGALRLRRPGAPVMLDVVRNGGHWPMHATLGSDAA